MVEHLVRALPAAGGADDVYAESAAEFLTTHLLPLGRHERPTGAEHAAVRAGIAVMRDRLADTEIGESLREVDNFVFLDRGVIVAEGHRR